MTVKEIVRLQWDSGQVFINKEHMLLLLAIMLEIQDKVRMLSQLGLMLDIHRNRLVRLL